MPQSPTLENSRSLNFLNATYASTNFFYRCTVHFDIHKVHTPTNALFINLLTPNVNYSGRTAPLPSKVAFYIFIQQI